MLIFTFLFNDLSFAVSELNRPTLGVQSIFNPILDVIGKEYETSIRIESAVILSMVQADPDIPFHEINAELNKWYGKIPGRERILDVLPQKAYDEGGKTVIYLRIMQGPYKGNKLKLISTCVTPDDIQNDETKTTIEFLSDAEKIPDIENFIKVVPMEIGRARKASDAEIIYTSKISDPGKRVGLINEAVRSYQEDTPDFIVDYADGIDRSNDEMIIIRESGGPVLGFISYGKEGDLAYKVYFQYVMRQARERRIGRNLIKELVNELRLSPKVSSRRRLISVPLTYESENLWVSMFGPESVVDYARQDHASKEYVRRLNIDLGTVEKVDTNPVLAEQPVLNESFIATIDGPSGTGKSTSASEAAKRLGAVFFSYGKIYRLITWMALQEGVEVDQDMDDDQKDSLSVIAGKIDMGQFRSETDDHGQRYFYGEKDITGIFYSEEIARNVPFVAAVPKVRWYAVRMIRNMIKGLRDRGVSVILEGRVTGIEIAPEADIKMYLTAKPEVRARRRALQMVKKDGLRDTFCKVMSLDAEGYDGIPDEISDDERFERIVQVVAESIEARDRMDREREHMPASVPSGAVYLDSSDNTFDQTVQQVVDTIEISRIKGLIERNIPVDDDMFERLDGFYHRYIELVQRIEKEKGLNLSASLKNECLKPEKIADLFYLSEVYKFNVFDLISDKKSTRWIDMSSGEEVEYIFKADDDGAVVMTRPQADGDEEIAKAERGSFAVKDTSKYYGRNLENFVIKSHFFVLWASQFILNEDVGVAWSTTKKKLISYYKQIGADTYRDFEGDIRANFIFSGGLGAAILTPAAADRIGSLDPGIWKTWSQRRVDRYMRLVRDIDPQILEKVHKTFNKKHMADKFETLRAITPGEVANYVLLENAECVREHGQEDAPGADSSQDRTGEYAPVTATEALFSLRDSAGRERDEVLRHNAASIIVDPATGERSYYSEGKSFVPVQGHVYVKEGGNYDIPEGIEFPEYLRAAINTAEGALVLAAGPFYDKVEGALTNSSVRVLTDEEVYKKFGLRRVIGTHGDPFDMPMLGIAGRSTLLPVPYTVEVVDTANGRRVVRTEEDRNRGTVKKCHVFGLEYKNMGTPEYTKHNISRMFKATVIDEYVGKPGIFLPWEHQFGRGFSVGLGAEYEPGTTIPKEISAFDDGATLTRWTLANMPLVLPYVITLRSPVGDYRRLASFFDTWGNPETEHFYAVIEEMGLSLEEYYSILCRNYGNNMRKFVNTDIMQSTHGSMIDTDILGHVTDLGDFWKISGENERFLVHAVTSFTENLVKVLKISGDENKDLQNRYLREYARSYFAGDADVEDINIDIDDTADLEKAIYDHALAIVRDTEARENKTERREATGEQRSDAEGLIDKVNDRSMMVFAGIKRHFDTIVREHYADRKSPGVNFVIDLSLISGQDEEDMNNNITTWAYLILLCRDLDNVNFTFKLPYGIDERTMPEGLLEAIRNSADRHVLMPVLKEKMMSLADLFGFETDVNELFRERVNPVDLEDPIEVPLLSRSSLEWLEDTGRELDSNQFPVALEDAHMAKGEGVLHNFEAALTVGLSNSMLAMAKRRGRGVKAMEDAQIRRVIEDSHMLTRLQDLYDVIFDGKIRITEKTLMNMVYDDSRVKIDLAISFSIPQIVRMAIGELQELHETVHDLLRSA